MKVNVRTEAGLLIPETGEYFELDIYLPSLKLAFEYQEKHHYTSSDSAYKPLAELKDRDRKKKAAALAKGITLIIVPCWWDGGIDRFAALLH